jgi:hypothetical protein
MPGNISSGGSLMPDIADALVEDRHGTLIAIEVTTGAKTNSFPAGYNAWRKTIRCRVTAPAVDGKANRAIISLISETCAIPAAEVVIRSGAASRQKQVLVRGMDKKDLLGRLEGR